MSIKVVDLLILTALKRVFIILFNKEDKTSHENLCEIKVVCCLNTTAE